MVSFIFHVKFRVVVFFFFCSLITFSLWCLLQFADVVSNSCLPLVTLINGLAKAG